MGLYLWMTNGGPAWFGSYIAGQMLSTPRPSDTPNEGHGEPGRRNPGEVTRPSSSSVEPVSVTHRSSVGVIA